MVGGPCVLYIVLPAFLYPALDVCIMLVPICKMRSPVKFAVSEVAIQGGEFRVHARNHIVSVI